MKAVARFRIRLRGLVELEAFLHGLHWLDGGELNRALIVTGEILDNIIAHSPPGPLPGRILFRVAKGRRTTILARFRERGFAAFVAKLGQYGRYYDERSRRERGFGLLLCERLSRKIRYRSGRRWQSVLIEL